jgi:hypothetical protein
MSDLSERRKSFALSLRPDALAAGIGGAAGGYYGTKGSLGDKWGAARDSFFEANQDYEDNAQDELISKAEDAINNPDNPFHHIADKNDVMGTAMKINFYEGMLSGGAASGTIVKPKFGKPGGINPFGADVRPFMSREAREDAAYAKKHWSKFLEQKNTIGKMVNPDDLSAGVVRPKHDEISHFTDKAAAKMAGKINLEKAKAGELHKEWPYLQRVPYNKEAFEVGQKNYSAATDQLKKNSEDFRKWSKKLYEGNPSKEEIKLYEEMQNDHVQATRNVRGHLGGFDEGPLPPKMPGDKIDAADAFEMWGGRPSVENPAGKVQYHPRAKDGYQLRVTRENPYTGQRDVEVYFNGKWAGTSSGTRKTDKELLKEWMKKRD